MLVKTRSGVEINPFPNVEYESPIITSPMLLTSYFDGLFTGIVKISGPETTPNAPIWDRARPVCCTTRSRVIKTN